MASIIQSINGSDLTLQAASGKTVVFISDVDGTVPLSVIATKSFVESTIATLINSAPGVLDTLGEIAAALEGDADFAETMSLALADKANSADVYTSAEVDTALADKANSADVYTSAEVDTALADKANSADVYTSAEVDTALADKANSADVYTSAEVDTALGRKQDEFVLVPTSSIGVDGDTIGQIAISSDYIFYCTATYTDGLSDIWARTPLTLETW
jgi:hypothetical protein